MFRSERGQGGKAIHHSIFGVSSFLGKNDERRGIIKVET
jgi:hypothetical protein